MKKYSYFVTSLPRLSLKYKYLIINVMILKTFVLYVKLDFTQEQMEYLDISTVTQYETGSRVVPAATC